MFRVLYKDLKQRGHTRTTRDICTVRYNYEVSKRRPIAAIGTLNVAALVYCFLPRMAISCTAVPHTVPKNYFNDIFCNCTFVSLTFILCLYLSNSCYRMQKN